MNFAIVVLVSWLSASALSASALSASAAGGTASGADGSATAGAWRYVTPPLGAPFGHAPLRIVPLSGDRPADLKETASYRGERRRYASLKYGIGLAAPVMIVLDEGPAGIDCYVDADRNRTIADRERLEGKAGIWQVAVSAFWQEGNTVEELKRTLVFRYGKVTRTLSVATCGYVEGQVTMAGGTVAVRRVDGDANGLFGDPQDRLWIDLDNNGQWDGASEEHVLAPFVRLNDRRWVVRGDPRGTKLTLTPLEGTGVVRLALPANLSAAQVEDIQVTLESRDGVVASIRQLSEQSSLPVGSYRVSALLLTLKNEAGARWGFVFGSGKAEHRWHEVRKDQTCVIDPIAPLEFTLHLEEEAKGARAGATVSTRPALYTGDGLLIEQACRGEFQRNAYDPDCSGRIELLDQKSKALDSATSGFA